MQICNLRDTVESHGAYITQTGTRNHELETLQNGSTMSVTVEQAIGGMVQVKTEQVQTEIDKLQEVAWPGTVKNRVDGIEQKLQQMTALPPRAGGGASLPAAPSTREQVSTSRSILVDR
ncbi:unnamed protein product [Prorocentrum cordatum]|uniref:Uncharacterized protein n=1 Tax=Prorocentrum cordatum TaxID=2364126 RepID=A0ABN9TXP5_9DINO|nr:unnamed protein product [Polarella glacialis]